VKTGLFGLAGRGLGFPLYGEQRGKPVEAHGFVPVLYTVRRDASDPIGVPSKEENQR